MWSPEYESMAQHRRRELQFKRLKATVERVYNHVAFYRAKMEQQGITPADLKSLEDIVKLPFTTKEDLRVNYPFGLFAADLDEVVRIHASSGTTGKMTVVGYTKMDIGTWAEVMARSITSAGGGRNDRIQIAYGYGLFTGGLGAHYGAELVGAMVIPTSGGNTKRQLQVMQDFGVTMLACTPSYALYMAETAADIGLDLRALPLRSGVFGAEPWSEQMRKRIEEMFGIKAYDIYGLSEIVGPGVAIECSEQNGLHIAEDHFLPEIIDPQTGCPLPEGEKGELVFTTLTKEAFPLLRYRTKDLSFLYPEVCSCGRTTTRMHRVLGRTDDMLIIRGVNVFPSQIESVLLENGDTTPHYQLIVTRMGNLDDLEVRIEVSDEMFASEIRKLEELGAKIRQKIESALGINVRVKLVEPKTIPRSEGKAQRVIDQRNLYEG